MIILNGKEYKTEIDFNTMCEMEEKGIQINNIKNEPFKTIRGVLAILLELDDKTVGVELTEHIKKGGSVEELVSSLVKVVEDSGFFQALGK